MTEPIEFAKLSASGNDFICIDNRDGRYDALLDAPDGQTAARVHFARTLCSRGHGIGGDGVIFAGSPAMDGVAEIGARFIETDGSDCALCGNGTACFVHWVAQMGWVASGSITAEPGPPAHLAEDARAGRRGMRILTPAGVVLGQDLDEPSRSGPDGHYARVCISLPQNLQCDLSVTADGRELSCDYVETGIPHVVTYVDDIESADVGGLGPALRHHQRFAPRGANANFVEVLGEGEIALRTYEFGVEGETLACGTGSAAAAILTALRHDWPEAYTRAQRPILVHSRGGDVLRVYFAMDRDKSGERIISDVCLETVVRFVFYGRAHDDLARRALP
ncbi:MAG: diaminopimelate epimerase [Planctomycetota bacterium]